MSEQLPILLPTKELIQQFWNPTGQLMSPSASKMRDELLERSEAIERVTSDTSRQFAVDVLGDVSKMLTQAEEVRTRAKKPFADFGKRIDETVKVFSVKLLSEKERLKRALGTFQAEQDRIAREARLKQEAELAALQAERKAAELAAALAQKSEEVQQAQEAVLAADLKAAELVMSAPVVASATVEGAKIKRSFKVEVLDPAALWRVFPDCIELKPRMMKINECVKALAATLPEGEVPQMPGCKVTAEVDFSAR